MKRHIDSARRRLAGLLRRLARRLDPGTIYWDVWNGYSGGSWSTSNTATSSAGVKWVYIDGAGNEMQFYDGRIDDGV